MRQISQQKSSCRKSKNVDKIQVHYVSWISEIMSRFIFHCLEHGLKSVLQQSPHRYAFMDHISRKKMSSDTTKIPGCIFHNITDQKMTMHYMISFMSTCIPYASVSAILRKICTFLWPISVAIKCSARASQLQFRPPF